MAPFSRELPPSEANRIRKRFELLLSLSDGILSEHSIDALLQHIVDAAREVVGARFAALGVLAEDGATLEQFVTSGMSDEERKRIGDLPRGRGLLGSVIRERKPIRTADLNTHPERYGFPAQHPPMRSFLGVPVAGRAGVYGNLYLTEKTGAEEFSEEDEDVAVLLAAQAAAAIESARLLDESQRLLGQVRDMQRQRDLFFAMMNHELRNALTGVYGWAERLVRRKGADGNERAAREVYEAAERTITLLNNFLDLARLDAGKVQPVWHEVDLPVSVERALAGLRPVAEAKGLIVETRIAEPLPAVRTDPMRVEQILVNLLSNAVRHCPEGRSIEVRVSGAGGEIRIDVADQGPGIPVAQQSKIFEPFERYDPNSGIGTGLGLPVSRRLAEVLGGRLTVESDGENGSTFILILPLAPPT